MTFKIWNENGTPKIDHLPSPSCWGTVPEHKGARVGVEGECGVVVVVVVMVVVW